MIFLVNWWAFTDLLTTVFAFIFTVITEVIAAELMLDYFITFVAVRESDLSCLHPNYSAGQNLFHRHLAVSD